MLTNRDLPAADLTSILIRSMELAYAESRIILFIGDTMTLRNLSDKNKEEPPSLETVLKLRIETSALASHIMRKLMDEEFSDDYVDLFFIFYEALIAYDYGIASCENCRALTLLFSYQFLIELGQENKYFLYTASTFIGEAQKDHMYVILSEEKLEEGYAYPLERIGECILLDLFHGVYGKVKDNENFFKEKERIERDVPRDLYMPKPIFLHPDGLPSEANAIFLYLSKMDFLHPRIKQLDELTGCWKNTFSLYEKERENFITSVKACAHRPASYTNLVPPLPQKLIDQFKSSQKESPSMPSTGTGKTVVSFLFDRLFNHPAIPTTKSSEKSKEANTYEEIPSVTGDQQKRNLTGEKVNFESSEGAPLVEKETTLIPSTSTGKPVVSFLFNRLSNNLSAPDTSENNEKSINTNTYEKAGSEPDALPCKLREGEVNSGSSIGEDTSAPKKANLTAGTFSSLQIVRK